MTFPAASAQPAPPMGWYPTEKDDARWWDGQKWTGMRVRGGVPGIDWSTTDQPALNITLGCVFGGLGLLQLLLAVLSGSTAPQWFLFLALGALWIAMGARGLSLQRRPAPTTGAIAPDQIRPLPWEVEGPGAGWYPVTRQLSRYWTGARWTQYTAGRFGVRPTFHGPKAYQRYWVAVWIMLGLGILGLLGGILLLAAGGATAGLDGAALTLVGVGVLTGGILFGVLGLVFVLLRGTQRRALLLPEQAPGL